MPISIHVSCGHWASAITREGSVAKHLFLFLSFPSLVKSLSSSWCTNNDLENTQYLFERVRRKILRLLFEFMKVYLKNCSVLSFAFSPIICRKVAAKSRSQTRCSKQLPFGKMHQRPASKGEVLPEIANRKESLMRRNEEENGKVTFIFVVFALIKTCGSGARVECSLFIILT